MLLLVMPAVSELEPLCTPAGKRPSSHGLQIANDCDGAALSDHTEASQFTHVRHTKTHFFRQDAPFICSSDARLLSHSVYPSPAHMASHS